MAIGRPTLSRRWAPRLAASAAGAALALVFPAPNLWWWAFVGLVPILLLVRAAGSVAEGMWRAWFSACGFFATLHYWLLPHLWLFAVPLVLVMGLVWVPFGFAAWSLMRGQLHVSRALWALAGLPAVWLATEYLRSWDRLGGSWGALGLSQWSVPSILSIAALGGVWMVSALLLVTNVAGAVALAPGATRPARAGSLCIALVAVATTIVFASQRAQPRVEGGLRVGGVQAGVVHGPSDRLDRHERITRELVRTDPGVEVVVWGQSSVGFDVERNAQVRRRLLTLAADIDRPLLVNVDARLASGRIAKTAVVIDAEGLDDTYRKQRLVPFGEYIPLRSAFGWVENFTAAAKEDRVPGGEVTIFAVADVSVGPLISYESTFPDLRRALARLDVDMTVVQAGSTTFQGTWALPQQASFEAVRAVESGRSAALVAVSGTSAAFDAHGRELAWVPQDYVGSWAVDVPLSAKRTLFVRWGPWVPLIALAVTTILVGGWIRRVALTARRGPDTAS